MSARSIRAAQLRRELITQLGGKCFRCCAVEGLQFHLKISDGGKHHAMKSSDRVYFYAKMVQAGNIELLCAGCHGRVTVAENRFRRLRRFLQGVAGLSQVAAAAKS